MIAFNAIHAEITWSLSSNGTLTISGTGDMEDTPWSYQRNNIQKVVINNGVTNIGNYAFSECTKLNSIIIPNSVTYIGDRAFNGCSSLTSVNIPNSVTSIGGYAFNGCSSLTSITIPNSVTSIGLNAFNHTKWYDNQPDGLVYAGLLLYKYKGTMATNTKIEIKDGIIEIGDFAFNGCTGLTSITIPNSVTSIGECAFDGCI